MWKIPAEIEQRLSHECIDFLSCLLAGPESRIGNARGAPNEYENGFAQVIRHPWFHGFDFDNLSRIDGPLLPPGSNDFPKYLEILK